MRRGAMTAVVAMSASAAFSTGCGTSCAGPALESTHVAVQGSPWLAVHPGATLRACEQARRLTCVNVTRGNDLGDGTHLYVRDQQDKMVRLRVIGEKAGTVLLDVATTVHLRTHKLGGGGCGRTFNQVYSRVQITANGAIRPSNTCLAESRFALLARARSPTTARTAARAC